MYNRETDSALVGQKVHFESHIGLPNSLFYLHYVFVHAWIYLSIRNYKKLFCREQRLIFSNTKGLCDLRGFCWQWCGGASVVFCSFAHCWNQSGADVCRLFYPMVGYLIAYMQNIDGLIWELTDFAEPYIAWSIQLNNAVGWMTALGPVSRTLTLGALRRLQLYLNKVVYFSPCVPRTISSGSY